jgi:hypothetical protein
LITEIICSQTGVCPLCWYNDQIDRYSRKNWA